MKKLVFAVDFDGTPVTHEYPDVGKELPGAVAVLKELVENGHRLILYTMRDDKAEKRQCLTEAVNWFAERDIKLWGIQKNPSQKFWSTSPKVYANHYIDDAALGCPLINDPAISDRPFVDWTKVRELLVDMGAL